LETGYKVDAVEAPSVAICPWKAATAIHASEARVTATHFGTQGAELLDAGPEPCSFDRECVCVDLSAQRLRDHRHWGTEFTGTTGVVSKARVKFRERIELKLHNVSDPSAAHTLKIGLYDSEDPAPMWFYMHEGGYVLGQLELHTWRVSDFTVDALRAMWNGDAKALFKPRHIWRYTSQEIRTALPHLRGHRGAKVKVAQESRISYEMKNYFVGETISSESAFSPYTLALVLAVLVMRSAVIEVCINALFPVWVDPKQGPTQRELSPAVQCLQRCCGGAR